MKALALALLLLVGLALVSVTSAKAEDPATSSSEASMLACRDNPRSYSKPSGSYDYPVSNSSYLITTSSCNDIQIKPTSSRDVRVCFRPSSGAEYCQSNHKTAKANTWTVIATNVLDGTRFYFWFESSAASSGVWAA